MVPSDSRSDRRPLGDVEVATLVWNGSPPLPASPSRRAVPTTPADRTGARVDCFPIRAAFPVIRPGRHPHLSFRGLLRLHSRYGPSGCSAAQGGLRREASAWSVTQPRRSPATRPNRQLSGWILPPLVMRALGAHRIEVGDEPARTSR